MIAIRRANSDDAAALTRLSFETFWDAFAGHRMNSPADLDDYIRRAFTLERIEEELSDPNAVFTVAETDGEMAGYSKLLLDNIEPGITAESPVELVRLYSHQRYLGKGVGQALMERCFEDARNVDRDVIWLGVWEYNPRARRFYEKHGFHLVGKHIFQLGADPQTDLLLQREL